MIKKSLGIIVLLIAFVSGVAFMLPPPPLEAPASTAGLAPLAQVSCTVRYDKTASPTQVNPGGVVQVTLTVQATDCDATTSPVDVILVIDRSGSMGGTKIADAKKAAIAFVNKMGPSDQVGVATFASSARLDQQLTNNKAAPVTPINNISTGGGTNIGSGLEKAEQELESPRHIVTHPQVIILLSDGYQTSGSQNTLNKIANRIKGKGIRIITIGLGTKIDEKQLRGIASSVNDYYPVPSSSDLSKIYDSILGSSLRVAARNMIISDTVSSEATLLLNSFQGLISPIVTGNEIVWQVGQVPTSTISLAYSVAMTQTPGLWDTNQQAIATYIDPNGNGQNLTFPKPKVEVVGQCGPPTLSDIDQKWVCVNKDQPLLLTGGGFYAQNLEAAIDGLSLTINSASERGIAATLPAGLGPGTYDVTVINQCPAPIGDLSDSLPGIFAVYPPPQVLNVRPPEGYQDVPTEITICGDGFAAPGTQAFIQVGGNKIPLDNQGAYGDNCLLGTVPSTPTIVPGDHTIIVEGPCGTDTGPYRVLGSSLNNDLFGQELWIGPSICVRQSDDIDIGLRVHRRGGKDPIENLVVRFYQDQISPANVIGDGTIVLLPPRAGTALGTYIAGTSTTPVRWTPSQGIGAYTLYAVIDPDNAVMEDIETNNIISRTVRVLPNAVTPNADTIAPVVDSFQINRGSTTTHDQEVLLQIEVRDDVNPLIPSSGIKDLHIVELLFNESNGIWVPVASSGWISYTKTLRWTLAPQGGLRYLQAWVSDNNGNVTRYPFQQQISYIKPCDPLPRNGSRAYRENLNAGDTLIVQVEPCSGDPDLYVWPPDWTSQGRAPLVSNQFNGTEVISWTVPVAGVYQIEVYGYNPGQYSIQIETYIGSGSPREPAAYTAGVSDKPFPQRLSADAITVRASGDPKDPDTITAPVVPPDSVPDVTAGVIQPPQLRDAGETVNIPLIIK